MQLEIDRLRRRLRHKRRRRTPSGSDPSFDNDGDSSYRPKTFPTKSFSYDEDRRYKQRSKSPSRKRLGNDAKSRAFNQISKLPFTHRIKGGKLPWRFTQPIFTMYNGRKGPEHVGHFN